MQPQRQLFDRPHVIRNISLLTITQSARLFDPTGDFGAQTRLDNSQEPVQVHATAAGSTLTTDNGPRQAGQPGGKRTKITQERFKGHKLHDRIDHRQIIQARQPAPILDTDSKPHIGIADTPVSGQAVLDALAALGEDLIEAVGCLPDDRPDLVAPGIGLLEKEIGQRAREHEKSAAVPFLPWIDTSYQLPLPTEGRSEGSWHCPRHDILDSPDTFLPLKEVTMCTAGRRAVAAGLKVPSGIGPGNPTILSQNILLVLVLGWNVHGAEFQHDLVQILRDDYKADRHGRETGDNDHFKADRHDDLLSPV